MGQFAQALVGEQEFGNRGSLFNRCKPKSSSCGQRALDGAAVAKWIGAGCSNIAEYVDRAQLADAYADCRFDQHAIGEPVGDCLLAIGDGHVLDGDGANEWQVNRAGVLDENLARELRLTENRDANAVARLQPVSALGGLVAVAESGKRRDQPGEQRRGAELARNCAAGRGGAATRRRTNRLVRLPRADLHCRIQSSRQTVCCRNAGGRLPTQRHGHLRHCGCCTGALSLPHRFKRQSAPCRRAFRSSRSPAGVLASSCRSCARRPGLLLIQRTAGGGAPHAQYVRIATLCMVLKGAAIAAIQCGVAVRR